MKPKGNVKAVGLIANEKQSGVGVSALVICEDEEGNQFSGSFAYFVNELSPYSKEQGIPLRDWCRARDEARSKHPRRWYLNDESKDEQIQLYLAGKPADEFII